MLNKILALGALLAVVNASLYQGLAPRPTVPSKSIVRHHGYAALGHFVAPAHYAAPLAHASPLAYYVAPAPSAALYETQIEPDKDISNDE